MKRANPSAANRTACYVLWELLNVKNPHIYFTISPLCPSKGPIDMQDLVLKKHLHRNLSAQISNTAQTACLSSPARKTPGTKVSSINRDGLLFQPRDTDGEALVFSTPPEPTAHPGLPYVFAKALSQCHWLSIQSIEPQCLLFIGCLEGLTGYTDKTLIKTSSVTSCDLKAAWVLEPSVTSWRSPCLWGVCLCVCVGGWGA